MKKLILVRHASYEGNEKDPGLSNRGRSEASDLGKKIKALLPDDERVEVWTSPAARAYMTAQIVANKLGVEDVTDKDKLWSDNWHAYDFNWLAGEIASFEGENLVIVSHLEYVQDFPRILGYSGNSSSYAQGVLIENSKVISI